MIDFLTLFAIMTGAALVLLGIIGGIMTVFMIGPMNKRLQFLESAFKARSNHKPDWQMWGSK